MNFTYIAKQDNGFRMHQSHFQGSQAVLLKPKRQKWLAVNAESLETLRESIVNALNGSGQWKPYQALDFKTLMTIDDL